MSYYQYLETVFPLFLKELNIDSNNLNGLIVAHGDKARQYFGDCGDLRDEHLAAIYLLTYVQPYSREVRQTVTGWVDPKAWIEQNAKKFVPILKIIELSNRLIL